MIRRTLASWLVLGVAGLGCTQELGPAPEEVGESIALAVSMNVGPSKDARVDSSAPTRNFGTSSSLTADSWPPQVSYLGFEVTGVTGAVSRARVRVYVTDSSTNGPAIFATSNEWTEPGVTWDTRPAPTGEELADVTRVRSGRWVEYDVGDVVTGDGPVAFALVSTSSNGTSFASRESATPPTLVLDVVPAAPPPAPVDAVAPGTSAIDGGGLDEPGQPDVPDATSTPTPASPDATPPPPPPSDAAPPPPADVVLVGAGDIAGSNADITADLIEGIEGAVFTLGDNAYSSGTASEFESRFEPTWGRFKSRILFPTPGNHDYVTSGASAYFDYFGAAAGDPSKGYYSKDLGAWHIIVLNSNCSAVGGCGAGSPQDAWLRADLAAHPNACTLAMWHHPLFNIGDHASETHMRPLYQVLYDAGADVVLAGHDHNYQRWTPLDPAGVRDDARGIRSFVVGTGGIAFYALGSSSRVDSQNTGTYGVLKLVLKPTSYTWEFVPEPGKSFTDSGSGTCH